MVNMLYKGEGVGGEILGGLMLRMMLRTDSSNGGSQCQSSPEGHSAPRSPPLPAHISPSTARQVHAHENTNAHLRAELRADFTPDYLDLLEEESNRLWTHLQKLRAPKLKSSKKAPAWYGSEGRNQGRRLYCL